MDPDNISAARVQVGCTSTGRRRDVYFSRFSTLEYGQSFIFPPKASVLTKLRTQAPDGFSFFVRAWQCITHPADSPTYERLPHEIKGDPLGFGGFQLSPEVDNAWRNTLRAARRLGAAGVVFSTPASFTPTANNRQNMSAFFERIAADVSEAALTLVWEPAGLWSLPEVEALASDLGLIPCWDPLAREVFPVGEQAYLRVTSLGRPVAPSISELSWLADGLRQYAAATCIFDMPSMFSDAQRLVEQLATG